MNRDTSEATNITIGETVFSVRVADSDSERTQGLSGTEPLPEKTGLWFAFDESALHSFWMKDMRYPIDIIWFDENLRVIHIEKNLAPETYPKTFVPPSPARYVLELAAGSAERYGITVGSTATLE